MGVISKRRRKQRLRHVCRCAALAAIVMLLGITASSSGAFGWARAALDRGLAVFSAGRGAQAEIALQEKRIAALQLGVFDSEERALSEAQRLDRLGVRCMVWQSDRFRLIADAAERRDALHMDAAKGQEAYVIDEKLEAVRLRVEADADGIDAVCRLLALPDETLEHLFAGTAVDDEIAHIRPLAVDAAKAHPEHKLFCDLAANLLSWCDRMELLGEDERDYGKAAMLTLCWELRQALIAASTASAQRTPSTAADVMPPAYPAPSPQG